MRGCKFIKIIAFAIICCSVLFNPAVLRADDDFDCSAKKIVNLKEYIPSLIIDLKYKTEDNFTKGRLYAESFQPLLRKGTADKLKNAQEEFMKMGYRIKVYDAYRPESIQYKLWNKCSDTRFIANPMIRPSVHSRGAAVDISLVDDSGQEIPMPSRFDEFNSKADRDYSDVEKEAAENAEMLENVMIKNGFESIQTEWWHFNDTDKYSYNVIEPEDLEKQENLIKIPQLSITLDNKLFLLSEYGAFMEGKQILIPLKSLSNMLAVPISWNSKLETASLVYENKLLTFKSNYDKIAINGKLKKLSYSVKIDNETLLVPLWDVLDLL